MDITIHASFLPHDDPDASLAFYRDTLGFEVRSDVGQGKMRWITVGPAGQPSTYRERTASATAGMPACMEKQVTRPIRNREAPATGLHLA